MHYTLPSTGNLGNDPYLLRIIDELIQSLPLDARGFRPYVEYHGSHIVIRRLTHYSDAILEHFIDEVDDWHKTACTLSLAQIFHSKGVL